MDEDTDLMAELFGPRHDGTDLIYSKRDDEGNPTAFWTIALRNDDTGKWLFRVRNWRDLHASEAVYDTEQEARAAGYEWLAAQLAAGETDE